MAEYKQAIPFMAVISEDGTIYEWESGTRRTRHIVGCDSQREEEYLAEISELGEKLESYYNKLVELGVIIPPKSAEEIAKEQAAEQAEINRLLLEELRKINKKVEKLEKGGAVNERVERDTELCEKQPRNATKPNRKSSNDNRESDRAVPCENQERHQHGEEVPAENKE
ncbi:MAG: hypothetical protein FWG90_05085 [Oscillospiraceae bacterium]|nr:hypothetical protein [Oscillospiraceae bacterium]